MAAGRVLAVLVVLSGGALLAGVILADMTTPTVQSYRRAHPDHHSAEVVESTGNDTALSNGAYGNDETGEHTGDYDRAGPDAPENDADMGMADNDMANAPPGGDYAQSESLPRWARDMLEGSERWMARQGWIAIPRDDIAPETGMSHGHQRGDAISTPPAQIRPAVPLIPQGRAAHSSTDDLIDTPSASQPDTGGLNSQFDSTFGDAPGQSDQNRAASNAMAPSSQDHASAAAARAKAAAQAVRAAEQDTD